MSKVRLVPFNSAPHNLTVRLLKSAEFCTKPRPKKYSVWLQACNFTFYQTVTVAKIAYFYVCCLTSSHDMIVRGVCIAQASKFCDFVFGYYWLQGIKIFTALACPSVLKSWYQVSWNLVSWFGRWTGGIHRNIQSRQNGDIKSLTSMKGRKKHKGTVWPTAPKSNWILHWSHHGYDIFTALSMSDGWFYTASRCIEIHTPNSHAGSLM